jgi:hypothetical protein
MYEMVIRLRTSHEQDHADPEQGWRATADPPPQSWWIVVLTEQSRRHDG